MKNASNVLVIKSEGLERICFIYLTRTKRYRVQRSDWPAPINQPIRELYAVTFRFFVTSNKLIPGPLITKSGCLTEFKKGRGSQIYYIFFKVGGNVCALGLVYSLKRYNRGYIKYFTKLRTENIFNL